MKKELLMILILTAIFSGCAKQLPVSNMSASYWYERVASSIAKGRLDQADKAYTSLQSEHTGSILLPEATLMLATAHIDEGEHLLGEYYLDEYIKRYANERERQSAEFMKVRSSYLSIPNTRRNQALIEENIQKAKNFLTLYPDSTYRAQVETIIVRLTLASVALDESIASLYERLDKPSSAEYYHNKQNFNWIDKEKLEPAEGRWYTKIFEGDGTSSWYQFMIPDTKSVVSRNN